jgi:MFS family permease
VQSPILNVNIFKESKALLLANVATLINYCATAAVVFLMSLYLQYIKGFAPDQAGLILLVQPAIQGIFSPLMGRLSDRIEPRIIASSGMALTFAALLIFSLLTEGTPIAVIVITLVILGLGFALFASPNTNAIMSLVTPKYYAVVSATMGTMRTIGQTFGMGITMIVIALVIGPTVITPEYYPAFLTSAKIAFGISAGLCLLGTFASFYRDRK